MAQAERFQIGDEVALRSGSPVMTVIAVNDDVVSCTFFNGAVRCDTDLPAASLVRYQARSFVAGGYSNADFE